MGWQTKADSFGGFHIVYAQENSNSCGIACLTMTVFKINKFHPGAGAFHKEKEIDKVYSHVSGTKYDGSVDSNGRFLALALNKLKCGSWKCDWVSDVPQAIIKSVGVDYQGFGMAGEIVNTVKRGDPIIVLVNWNGGDGHFVVIDTVYNVGGQLYAAICDPWDGNIHMTPFAAGKSFNYTGKSEVNLGGGGSHYNYDSASIGKVDGWVIRKI